MTLEELEEKITKLPPGELEKFREWFFEFDATQWDKKLESDIAAGKLDDLADRAIHGHRSGDSTPL